MRLPIRRPALPRASSAMSGFFFCGSIDEPVAYASSRRAKPNSSLVHSTHSSPIRDRWMPTSVRSNNASATKSRSPTASRLLSNVRAKPRSAAVSAGSIGNDEPGERARAERGHVEPFDGLASRGPRRGPAPTRGRAGGARAAPAGPAAGGCSRADTSRARRCRPIRPGRAAPPSGPGSGRRRPGAHACTTAGGPSPPGRSGCDRCAAWRRPDRRARSPVARRRCGCPRRTRTKTNDPAAISCSTASSAASTASRSVDRRAARPRPASAHGRASRRCRPATAGGRTAG